MVQAAREVGNLARRVMSHRLFRYGVAGGVTFIVNMLVVWLLIEVAGLRATEFGRNLAHFLGAEASILVSFHAHNFWTWGAGRHGYLRRNVQFHMLTGATIVLRQVGFFLLDRIGQPWLVSTLIPLSLAILVNFFGYDRFIFRHLKGTLPP